MRDQSAAGRPHQGRRWLRALGHRLHQLALQRDLRQRTVQPARQPPRAVAERGYDATTINDIAAAADIAPRTFFAYFPSKEAVVFHDADRDYDDLAATLAGRPEQEWAFTALRRWIEQRVAASRVDPDGELLRKKLCAESEELQRVQHGLIARIEDLLRTEIGRDLDEPPDALRPRLIAAATVAALRALVDTPARRPEDAAAVLDEALEFLQAGFEGLQRRERAD